MSLTTELSSWLFEKKCNKTVEALIKNGFKAVYAQNKNTAIDYILAQATEAKTVGFGGSMTVTDLNISNILSEQGKTIYNHNQTNLTLDEKINIMKNAIFSDLYLTGINAVTTTGVLVNIDATGNRVAAMTFGPKKVIALAGRNKIVEGDLSDAIRRIKDFASPPNAKRLSFKTPCAETGFCSDCHSPDRICRVISVLERCPRLTEFHVIIINEDLGF
ncbi:MAG: lactate utilization protein [bacterium]